MLALLKTRRFLPLFITQFLGAFNDNAFKNAFVIWYTYDIAVKTGANPATLVTLATALFILPYFLFSATAGQCADRFERAHLTRYLKLLEIILMLACPVAFYFENISALLVILFFLGVQAAFFGPIKYSLLPAHLKRQELIAGNGLIEGGTFLGILLGTIFGGIVILMEHGVLIISFAVIVFSCVGWVSSLFIPPARISDANLKPRLAIFKNTWQLINFARKDQTLWYAILGISWFWFIGATFLTQLPIFTKEIIHGNAHIVTLFLTVFSVGIGVGSIACNRLLKGEITTRLVPYGLVGMTLAVVCFTLASHLFTAHIPAPESLIGLGGFLASFYGWLIVLALCLLAVMSGIYIVPLYTLLQHRAEKKFLARIIASNNIMNALFMVIASVLALVLFAAGLTVNMILLVVGIANLGLLLVVKKI